ncbi:MAG: segregation ATPase FtsK/SpoIIIE, family [Pseudomonadota bacterium]|nr:segregation ATPase FtsK/SpoIIIE, family [Pseudomonadota bacterium]
MLGRKTTKFATKNRATILPTKPARFINDMTAVLLFAVAIVLGGMLLTYSGDDACWFTSSDSTILHNKFGILGSYIADIILSVFGRSGWWVTVGIFYLGYRKIIRDNINTGNWYSIFQVISFIFLLLSSSIFEYLSLYYYITANSLHNGNGGMIGRLLYVYLASNFGELPTTIFTLLVIITSFSFAFSLSILTIAEKIGIIFEFMYTGVKRLFGGSQESVIKSEPVINNSQVNAGDIIQDHDYSSMLDGNELGLRNKLTPAFISNKNSRFKRDILSPLPDHAQEDEDNNSSKNEQEDEELELGIEKPVKFKRIKQKIMTADGLPSTSLLNEPLLQTDTISEETLEFVSMSIENKLAEFGVEAKIVNAESGPVITRYELLPSRGVRGEKIVGLSKEIARGLALTNVRIVETIPGKNSMGIEVPNFKRKTIYLKEIFDSPIYKRNNASKLMLALGKDISGNVVSTDLAKMPHLLVAGTTGSGKSVAVNVMILSILFAARADEVKFIMIDPKMVELSFYQDIPHLLAPVVTDMTQAANALKWTVGEMERRYRVMAKLGCKNIASLNQKIIDAQDGDEPLMNPFSVDDEERMDKFPYIVVIIDELADLMMVTGKKIEQYIARIAQKARAVGIHLIVATQRPSVDVITGLIKANIPARISFQVSSKIDSRTILDQMGAETLLGQGDMLFLQPGSGITQRLHGAFVNDDELNKVVEFLKSTGKPDYIDEVLTGSIEGAELPGFEDESGNSDTEKDPIFDEAVKFIYDSKRCSISSLQTRFGIGYNRAARIMAHLESIGLVKRNDRGGFELLRNTQDVN